MPTILRLGLENAGAAGILALLTSALSPALRRRPAVVHVLWVLILVKLLAPAPVRLPVWSPALLSSSAADDRRLIDPEPVHAALALLTRVEDLDSLQSQEPPPPATVEVNGLAPATTGARAGIQSRGFSVPAWLTRAAVAVWLGGSALTLVVATVRVIRLRRTLELAEPAPEDWCKQVNRLADRIDLARRPRVVAVPGEVPPIVWGWGGTVWLVIPRELWRRLDGIQREALVVHELAHIKRGDDRVRWLEQVVTLLFWWFPVVWWARGALREAEERCCDAWVVWAIPGAARAYAETLVEAVDFLNGARTTTPALASGFGQARQLKRRLIMIMRGTTRRSLGWGGGLFALAVSAAILPVRPSWGQKPDAPPKPVEQVRVEVLGRHEPVVAGKPVEVDGDRVFYYYGSGDQAKAGPDQRFVVVAETVDVKGDDVVQEGPPDANEARLKALKDAAAKVRKEIAGIESKDGGKDDEPRVKALRKAAEELEKAIEQGGNRRTVIRRRVVERSDTPTSKPDDAERDAARDKLRAEMKELSAAVRKRGEEVREASTRLREAQQKLAEASRRLAEAEGRRVGVFTSRAFTFESKQPGVVEYSLEPKGGGEVLSRVAPPVEILRERVNRGDQEKRLSELESKLDQVIQKLEKLDKGSSGDKRGK